MRFLVSIAPFVGFVYLKMLLFILSQFLYLNMAIAVPTSGAVWRKFLTHSKWINKYWISLSTCVFVFSCNKHLLSIYYVIETQFSSEEMRQRYFYPRELTFKWELQFSSVAQSCLTLWPHGLQHARPPCTSPAPELLKLMSIESLMSSNHLILCRPLLLLPSIFPSIRVFSNESVLCIRWPKYWSSSFSINPSNEYAGLISFRMDWLDLLAVQGTQEFSPTPQFKSINSSALSFLYSPTLTSIHGYWKNHSFD